MFNRDSILWWIVIIGSVAGYLATVPPPTAWTWGQSMNAVVVICGLLGAKLSGSGLAGNATPSADKTTALGGLLSVYKKEGEKP
jgi:uncharacterized membrane protein YeaQ/YmgE (transglycosylase-associated protein family)